MIFGVVTTRTLTYRSSPTPQLPHTATPGNETFSIFFLKQKLPLLVHLPQFLDQTECGMAQYSEQCGESIHQQMKVVLSRFGVSEENQKHGERLKRAVMEFSTERL